MNLQLFIENFPWRGFGTPYETNTYIVKLKILKYILQLNKKEKTFLISSLKK